MRKIVINKCYGGFSLTARGTKKYLKERGVEFRSKPSRFGLEPDDQDFEIKKNGTWEGFWYNDISRDDSVLVALVEKFGNDISTSCSSLEVVKIPNKTKWQIDEYDGIEWVAEKHRTWA